MEKRTRICIGVALAATALFLVGCAGVGSNLIKTAVPNAQSKAQDAAAEALLRTAVSAAEMYAANHDGSYSGMTAAALGQQVPNIDFIDGAPSKASQVGVSDVTKDSYVIMVKSESGKTFKATRKAGESVVFD